MGRAIRGFWLGLAFAMLAPRGVVAAPPAADEATTGTAAAEPAAATDAVDAKAPDPTEAKAPEPAVEPEPAEAPEPVEAKAPAPAAEVVVHNKVVHVLHAALEGRSAEDRARRAAAALLTAAAEAPEHGRDEVGFELADGLATLRANGTEILILGPDDATAAGASSLRTHAEDVRDDVAAFLAAERKRQSVADAIVAWLGVILLGIVGFLGVPWLGVLSERAQRWVRSHPDLMPGLRVRGVEVLSRGVLQSLGVVLVSSGMMVLQLLLIYTCVVLGLSSFPATEGWATHINAFLAAPFSRLLQRFGAVLPTAALGAALMAVLVPAYIVVGQIFDSLESGDLRSDRIPPRLARTFKHIVRVGLVGSAILVFGPLATDEPSSLAVRLGDTALLLLALSVAPLGALLLLGLYPLLRGIYPIGRHLAAEGIEGPILAVDVIGVRVQRRLPSGRSAVTLVPHVWLWLRPATVAETAEPARVPYAVPRAAWTVDTLDRLSMACGVDVQIEVERVDATAVHLIAISNLPADEVLQKLLRA